MIAVLIRHGDTAAVNRYLAGRMPGLHLSEPGRQQALRLPTRVARYGVSAVYTSPLERARETAAPIAAATGIVAVAVDALLEVDFGDWTGRTFAALDALAEWQAFNARRCSARPPNGERLPDLQARIVSWLEEMRSRHGADAIAIVSHAEVIRSAVLHYLTMSLDLSERIEISPASITALELTERGPRFMTINDQDVG